LGVVYYGWTMPRIWAIIWCTLGLMITLTACGEPNFTTVEQVLAVHDQPRTDAEEKALARLGRQVFLRNNCHNCHGLNGQANAAPNLRRLYTTHAQLADGSEMQRDAAYLARSILEPQAQVVAGYAQPMTKYAAVVSPDDVAAILAYLHQFSPPPSSEADSPTSANPH
jgi:cytochrome c oxidase subunit 2